MWNLGMILVSKAICCTCGEQRSKLNRSKQSSIAMLAVKCPSNLPLAFALWQVHFDHGLGRSRLACLLLPYLFLEVRLPIQISSLVIR